MLQKIPLPLALLLLVGTSAYASSQVIPPSLSHEILSEDSPTAWKPTQIGIEQFEPKWVDSPIEGVNLALGLKSFDWVRIMDVMVLPRGMLVVEATDIEEGAVSASGAGVAMVRDSDGVWRARVPVALLGDPDAGVEIQVKRQGKVMKSVAGVRFNARNLPLEELVGTDTTCSRYAVRPVENQLKSGKSWVMAGCRYVYTEGSENRVSTLELYLHWEGAGEEIRANGLALRSIRPGLWLLRLPAHPGTVELSVGEDRLKLQYSIPERAHYLRFAGGIGPYAYTFSGNGESASGVTLMPSVYGSYYFTDEFQITTFATALLEQHWLTTWGVYLRSRSFRFLDRRFAISLNVGGQFIGFASQGQYYFILRYPQGSELTWTDALGKGRDLVFGVFYYPLINGVSYSEFWVRVTQGRLFGEINYVDWTQPAQAAAGGTAQASFTSRSFGLSIGIPLGGML